MGIGMLKSRQCMLALACACLWTFNPSTAQSVPVETGLPQAHDVSTKTIEITKTRLGSLAHRGDDAVFDAHVRLMEFLPPLSTMAGNGLRLTVLTSGPSHYAVALWLPSPGALAAHGTVARIRAYYYDNEEELRSRRDFTLPAQAYFTLTDSLDKMNDGWAGSDDDCLDGTSLAFERVRGDHITSGTSQCSKRNDHMVRIVLNTLLSYAPGSDLPTEEGWYRQDEGLP